MSESQSSESEPRVDPEAEQIDVEDYKTVDEVETCAGVNPDGSRCDGLADYVLAVSTGDTVGVLPFCEDHANLGDTHE